MSSEYELKKIHITVAAPLYDELKRRKLFLNIDKVISDLLIEHFQIGKE